MKKATQKEWLKANSFRRLFDRSCRPDTININSGNTIEHELTKCYLCIQLAKEGRHFLTEATFTHLGKKGRADIVDLTEGRIIEITESEETDSIAQKRNFYPLRLFSIPARKTVFSSGRD